MPASTLDAIQEDNHGRMEMSRNCLRDMFLWWLRNGKTVTAKKLAIAAHDVGEHSVEIKINRNFGKYM